MARDGTSDLDKGRDVAGLEGVGHVGVGQDLLRLNFVGNVPLAKEPYLDSTIFILIGQITKQTLFIP